MLLKKFEEPTDIFIVGCCLYDGRDWTGDVLIQDDENQFVITINNYIEKRLTCDGFINVITREEFVKYKDHFSESMIDYDDFVVIKDFVGEVGVKVVAIMNGKENVHIEELDLDEYLADQEALKEARKDEAYKNTEYCITLPTGTEMLRGRYNDDSESWEVKKWVELEV